MSEKTYWIYNQLVYFINGIYMKRGKIYIGGKHLPTEKAEEFLEYLKNIMKG